MAALQTFRLFNNLGQPLVGASPVLNVYRDGSMNVLPPPAVFALGLGKYGFIYDSPTAARVYRIEVVNFDPATATAIRAVEPITFDVVDTLASLQRVVVLVSFPNLNLYEVAHDGDALGPVYRNSFCTRTPITNGFRYTLLRDSGWPSSPRVVPMAFDAGGGVNPISNVIYAWTLVE